MGWKTFAGTGLAVTAVLLAGCVKEPPAVPRELVGAWITDDPRYQDCAMIITGKTVLFKQAGGRALEHAIHRVESGPEKKGTRFTFYYHDEYKNDYELNLVYESVGGGSVTFLHQPGSRWVRAGGAS